MSSFEGEVWVVIPEECGSSPQTYPKLRWQSGYAADCKPVIGRFESDSQLQIETIRRTILWLRYIVFGQKCNDSLDD